jgi:hypothetical protein
MRKLFLPFRWMCLFAFHQGISIEPRVLRAPTSPLRLPFPPFALISRSLPPPSSPCLSPP